MQQLDNKSKSDNNLNFLESIDDDDNLSLFSCLSDAEQHEKEEVLREKIK